MSKEKRTAETIVKEWKKEPNRVGLYSLFHKGIGADIGGVNTGTGETLSLTLTETVARQWSLNSLLAEDSGDTFKLREKSIPLRHTTLVSLRMAIDEALEYVDKRDSGR